MRVAFGLILVICSSLWGFTIQAQPCAPVVNLGDTISFCQGNSITLNASCPNCTYVWSTGSNSSNITVNTGGTYWVRAANNCSFIYDSVFVITDAPINVNLGNDRPICGSSENLSAPYFPGTSYLWSTGQTSAQISVSTPGIYWIKATNACGVFTDTVHLISQIPTGLNLGPDQFPCNGSSSTLSIPNSVSGTFIWSTGATSRQITVNKSGTYWAKVSTGCGTFTDTVVVQLGTDLNLGVPDTVYFCPGSNITISGSLIGSYSWSNGSTSKSITISQPGAFIVSVVHPCGVFTDTVIALHRSNPVVNLGPDRTVCFGTSLNANNPGSYYTWSNGATSQSISVNKSGTYWVRVNGNCGITSDTVNITVKTSPGDSIPDTVGFCGSNPTTLNAGYWGPATQYIWSNGATTKTNSYGTTGNHWVKVSNSCGSDTVHFYARPDNPLNVSFNDTSFCDSLPYFLTIPNLTSTDSVEWQNGSHEDSLGVAVSGTYWVKVMNSCDTVMDTVVINVYEMPKLLNDSIVYKCANQPITISAPAQNSVNYTWSTGSTMDSITVSNPGLYWLKSYNRCDTLRDTIYVANDVNLNLNLGPDTSFCRPDSLIVPLPANRSHDYFLNGVKLDKPAFVIKNSGQYAVEVKNSCGSFYDTLNVTVYNSAQKVLNNKAFCSGSSLNLDASQGAATSFLWNTGATSPQITVNQGGWYYVDISDQCKTIRDSVFVDEQQSIPPIDLGNDTIFCQGTLFLNPGNFPGATYRWQNTSRSQTLSVAVSGTYHVTISNTCNTQSDTIHVLITGPPVAILGTEVRYCASNTFNLNAQNPGCTYLWSTGDTSQSISISQPGIYWVTITNNCGQVTDSVSVIPEYPLNNLDLGNDTIICQGQSLLLDPHTGAAAVTWNTGSTDTILQVTQTGMYSLLAKNLCGTFRDSIFVKVQDIPVFDLKDTVICHIGGNVLIKGPRSMQSYQWSTGESGPDITVSRHGLYWLKVANHCFSYTDTFQVVPEYPIKFNFPEDTILCDTEILRINLNHIPYPVRWENNLESNERNIRKEGLYVARSANSCGLFYDSINVIFHEDFKPGKRKEELCEGDTLWIDYSDESYALLWPDGGGEMRRPISSGGRHELTIINECGITDIWYQVDLNYCDCPTYLAKAFTPNDDNLNDTYKPVSPCDFIQYKLQVYDRWGKMIFESNDPNFGWNGEYNGQAAPPGVYIYHLSYDWMAYDVPQHRDLTGHFSLIR